MSPIIFNSIFLYLELYNVNMITDLPELSEILLTRDCTWGATLFVWHELPEWDANGNDQ